MTDEAYLKGLGGKKVFSKCELLRSFRDGGYALGGAAFDKKVASMLRGGEVVRVGKGVYGLPGEGLLPYRHEYSDLAVGVAGVLRERYPLVDFTVFELTQLNVFVNHQLVHNTLFVSVEREAMDFVFETLRERYAGKVLIDPSPEIYHRYWSDGMIVVEKLVTEAPMGRDVSWHTGLEKLIVDAVSDKLISGSVAASEYPGMFEDAFSCYAVDEERMFRYARRRNADGKILRLIREKTDITLRTMEL